MVIMLFALQVLISLTIYILIAHQFRVNITILAAIVETALAMWVFDKLFSPGDQKEPTPKNIPREKPILRTVTRRKKVGV